MRVVETSNECAASCTQATHVSTPQSQPIVYARARAAARHSHSGRVHTDCKRFFFPFFWILQLFSQIFSKSSTRPVLVTSQISRTGLSRQLGTGSRSSLAVFTRGLHSRSLQAKVRNLGDDKMDCCGRTWEFLKKKLQDPKKKKLLQSAWTLTWCEWRAAAPGLKLAARPSE